MPSPITPHAAAPASGLSGPGFAMGSMVCSQLGIALAVPLMLAHGAFATSSLRLGFAALLCTAWARPNFWRFSRRQWLAALALGATMAWMTMCFFTAASLIPMGPAITIDFLGPLALAVIALRGWPRLALPLLAATGVLAVSIGNHGQLLNPAGILFAAGAGCGWALYIVLMRHVGKLFTAQEGLCLSLIFAATFALPAAWLLAPPANWRAGLPAIAGLAILSPLLPFALEMAALRRLDMGRFSILMSLEPVIGALFGFLILHQTLAPRQIAGILLVITASAAAVLLPAATSPSPKPRLTAAIRRMLAWRGADAHSPSPRPLAQGRTTPP
jgi:inner membrane transporter RhtA